VIQYGALLPLGAFLYVKALHGKYGNAIRDMWKKKPLSVKEELVSVSCEEDKPSQVTDDQEDSH
jgi:hypothetical protein